MPYKTQGNQVLHKKGGKWSVKQTCSSPEAAEKAIKLLQGVEHGWKPTGFLKDVSKNVPKNIPKKKGKK